MIVFEYGKGSAEVLKKRAPPVVSADSYPAKDSGNVQCCCASSRAQSSGSNPDAVT